MNQTQPKRTIEDERESARIREERREAYLAALKEELAVYEPNPDMADRADNVRAEIKRVEGDRRRGAGRHAEVEKTAER